MEKPVNRISLLTDDDICEMSANLIQSILDNNLHDARSLVESLSDDVRKELTKKHTDVDVNPAIFMAVKMGNPEFVRFLVNECHADLEEHGIYRVEDDNSEHIVTPLWCAAVADKLDVVRMLVSLGADVNAASDTGSTPVRSSCYMTNMEVVKFLAENGGDLEKPNQNGGTCLINSVQNVDLCRFLINRGVDVNARDGSGNIALHYAIKEGRFETVKLLVERGSDPYLQNDYGDDALQCASLRGFEEIVDYLIRTVKPSTKRQIESCQLLGCNFIDEKVNIVKGLLMWKKAIEMREGTAVDDKVGKTMMPNPAYEFALETTFLFELEKISINRDSVFMQALLIREQILGPLHKDTIFGLMYRGAVYADMHDYKRCIRLWKYAFKLRHSGDKHLCHEYIFTLQALCKLFVEIYHDDLELSAKKGLTFDEVFEVLEVVTEEAKRIRSLKFDERLEFQQEKLLCFMQLVLHLIYLLSKLMSNQSQEFMFKKLVYTLLGIGLRTSKGRTILLLSVRKEQTFVDDDVHPAFPVPSVSVVRVLLECGADVQEKDNVGNTVLHLLEKDVENVSMIKEVAELLVSAGAHIDARNNAGIPAAYHLTLDWLKMDFSAQTTLKCLSARVIRQCNIPYLGILPQPLHAFIEMH